MRTANGGERGAGRVAAAAVILAALLGGGAWFALSSSMRGIAEVAENLPSMLTAFDRSLRTPLAAGSAVILGSDTVATLAEVRRISADESASDAALIYSGAWLVEPGAARSGSADSLVAVRDGSGPGEPVVLRLVRDPPPGLVPVGVLWLDPESRVYAVYQASSQ